MKNIVIDTYFDVDPNDERSQVIELIPNTYHDYRGRFTEVYKNDKTSECWLVKDNSWIK
jgi:dTDP-4-dehydrorhamnose 3,5-epimerase-like enzyme